MRPSIQGTGLEIDRTLSFAQDYISAGISLVPVRSDGSKAPAVPWKEFQNAPPDELTVQGWVQRGYGLGIIGGQVSGNLEILDYEAAADIREFADRLRQVAPGLLEKLEILVRTPTGGHHILYRCSALVEGNQKLACDSSGNVVIETRGEGGYGIAPESPTACHPSGNEYKHLKGNFREIPVLTAEERQTVLETARSLNEYHPPARVIRGSHSNSWRRRWEPTS